MKIQSTNSETITWDLEGSGHFEVTLENNVIRTLKMCENGSDETKCLYTINVDHLRNLQKALTSLFNHIDAKHSPAIAVPRSGEATNYPEPISTNR